jgi:uncharacterized protein YdcH (DUF465 family)
MINILFSASEIFTQFSDILANYWDKILVIVGGTAGATTISILIIRWIWGLISAKIGKKSINMFLSKVAEFESKVTDLPNLINTSVSEQLNKYQVNLTAKFNNALKQYNETKQAVYTKVTQENEKAEQILRELKTTTLELKTEAEPIIEEIKETIEPIIENVSRETIDEEIKL